MPYITSYNMNVYRCRLRLYDQYSFSSLNASLWLTHTTGPERYRCIRLLPVSCSGENSTPGERPGFRPAEAGRTGSEAQRTEALKGPTLLYALGFGNSAFVDDVAGVQRGRRLEQQNPAFFISDGFVLNAAGNDDELAFRDPLVAVAKFHAEAAFDDEEEFVFVFVMVPDKFAFEVGEFDGLAVEFGSDVGLPVFGDLANFSAMFTLRMRIPLREVAACLDPCAALPERRPCRI